MKILEPSLLSFDFHKLPLQLSSIKKDGAEFIHYDVMDGFFVKNKTFGPEYLKVIEANKLKANVHMMVNDPIRWIKVFINYPINSLIFHPEIMSKSSCIKAFSLLKQKGIRFGIAIKTTINAEKFTNLIKLAEYVCVMSVEPGAAGQKFLKQSVGNLKIVYQLKQKFNPTLVIQLDGGVDIEIMKKYSGYVDHFISGSFLMHNPDKKAIFEFVKSL